MKLVVELFIVCICVALEVGRKNLVGVGEKMLGKNAITADVLASTGEKELNKPVKAINPTDQHLRTLSYFLLYCD